MTLDDLPEIRRAAEAKLPEYMVASLMSYVEHGRTPGYFLRAYLENDLRGAFAYADAENKAALQAWVHFYRELPDTCYGSSEERVAWVVAGGLRGFKPAPEEDVPMHPDA